MGLLYSIVTVIHTRTILATRELECRWLIWTLPKPPIGRKVAFGRPLRRVPTLAVNLRGLKSGSASAKGSHRLP